MDIPYTGLAILETEGSPNGLVVVQGQGQLCLDRSTPALYQGGAPGSTTWTVVAGGGGGGGIVSLTGPGVTATPGKLNQAGGLAVIDGEGDSILFQSNAFIQMFSTDGTGRGIQMILGIPNFSVGANGEGTLTFGNGAFGAEAFNNNPVGMVPLTVVNGVNDTFTFTPASTGTPEVFTFAPGTYNTAPNVITAMGAAIGATSGEAFSTICSLGSGGENVIGLSLLQTGTVGNNSSITPGPTDITATLGFDNPSLFTGGNNSDIISFFSNTGALIQSVSGALSAVTDAAAKAVLTSIISALSITAGYGLVIDATS
jgi:hypothetical protein